MGVRGGGVCKREREGRGVGITNRATTINPFGLNTHRSPCRDSFFENT